VASKTGKKTGKTTGRTTGKKAAKTTDKTGGRKRKRRLWKTQEKPKIDRTCGSWYRNAASKLLWLFGSSQYAPYNA
jgi:hypothetical protein